MTRPNMGTRVNAVQGDGNTRLVEITLLSGGAPWTPPEGVEAAIAYMQPGGTKGLYNKLADGTAAISISGNVATIVLAPQMLTASGTVQASLVFNDAALNRLTTFPFAVSVASNPAAGAQKTEDYIRLQWLEDKLGEYVKRITEGLLPGGAVSSVNGKTGAVVLIAEDMGAISKDDLQEATNKALAQAKASGEFDGADGKIPEYGVDYGTPEQIADIANQAAKLVEVPEPDLSGLVKSVNGKSPDQNRFMEI